MEGQVRNGLYLKLINSMKGESAMEEKYLVLGKIVNDQEAAKKLFSLSPEDAVVFLKEKYGLDFTAGELVDVAKGMQQAFSEDDSEELSEDALDQVAGGKSNAYNWGYYTGKTVKVVGTVAGIVAAAISMGW